MHKFLVLIFKHLVTRTRHYGRTFFELGYPILFIVPAVLMQNNIAGSTIDDLSHFQSEWTSEEAKYEDFHFKTIFYAPNNSLFYKNLMEGVVLKLGAQPSGALNINMYRMFFMLSVH